MIVDVMRGRQVQLRAASAQAHRLRSSWAISATIRAPARTKHAWGGASILIGSLHGQSCCTIPRNQVGYAAHAILRSA
jgi:hypothetical protein